MLTIHGRATSSNVQAVMWLVGELGLPCRRIDREHVVVSCEPLRVQGA